MAKKVSERKLPSDKRLEELMKVPPENFAEWAKKNGNERQLTDFCTQVLQGVGELPEPDYAPQRYKETPADQRRVDLEFGNYWAECRDTIQACLEGRGSRKKPVFLDVGGNMGECKSFAEGFEYWLVDLQPHTDEADRVIQGDICKPLPVDKDSVDVIFSNQVWEHLERPWLACKELGKLLKPGGLFVTMTLFSYRYHPFPADHFRYTHTGLASIHEEFAGTETEVCKYDLRFRRIDHRGGAHPLGSDRVPVDWLGGFRENWLVYYIGRKR